MGDAPVEMEDADLVDGELVIVRQVCDDQGRWEWLVQPFVGQVMVRNGETRITWPDTTPDVDKSRSVG